MAIPDYQTLMLPLLRSFSDNVEKALRDVSPVLAKEFNLSSEEVQLMLPSGAQAVFFNRINWARTYLKKAGLLDIPRRGFCKITPAGLAELATNPKRIDVKYLERFPSFLDFKENSKLGVADSVKPTVQQLLLEQTPEESIGLAYEALRSKLADDILTEVIQRSPKFFERLVLDLLLKMGYGKFRDGAGIVTGKSNDKGIDAVVSEDKLGLESVYIQAKRYATDNSIGSNEIRNFKGALDEKNGLKGVFITTSYFTSEAIEAAKTTKYKIVLIDGERLAELMIEYNLGVSTAVTYELKKVDTDFFSEE